MYIMHILNNNIKKISISGAFILYYGFDYLALKLPDL
jgi:hypothetical protein